MSNGYSSERTVPTLLLIIFIVVILAFAVSAYVIYTEQSRLEKEVVKARADAASTETGRIKAEKQLGELYASTGYATLKEIEDAFVSSAVPWPADAPKKLEALLTSKFDRRAEIVKAIGVDPTDVDENGASKFLEQTLTSSRRNASVPDSLRSALVGNLVEQYIRLDKAAQARADLVAQGEEAIQSVNKDIEAKKAETKTSFEKLDAQAATAWDERVVEQNRLRNDRPGWEAEREVLSREASAEKAVNAKLEQRLKDQRDMGTPLDGVIVAYDWRTRRGTISLGAANRVKAGYEFDVYTVRPGGDTAENRVYRGKIRLLNVLSNASLFAVIPSPWDNEDRPIMEGQRVSSQLYDNVRRKTFCLKGWFPEGGDNSKVALEGMIFRAGGVIENEVTLDTDFLVVGTISEEGLTNLSPQAKAAIAEGARAYEDARHFYVTVLTVEKLFKYWDNSGTRVEK